MLPPGAATAGGTWTSGLSVGEFAAIKSARFEPVGQVMGVSVHQVQLSTQWGTRCSSTPETSRAEPGLRSYAEGLLGFRRNALRRMAAECTALGGDGVVAVRLVSRRFPGSVSTVEFQAYGTAVRAGGEVRSPRPFLSHLSGQDFAKLIMGGWVPVDLVMGLSVGLVHRSWYSSGAFGGNFEVDGLTALLGRTRHEARAIFSGEARRSGAEGVVLSDQQLSVQSRQCLRNKDREDIIAEATFTGTSIAAFRTSAVAPSALTIMRLS